mmetsp:Transcript_17352/g.29029  ORF Transcript_17352/g.29029 Transcript_17352/m.29029 type:complete len:243 (-) Transcript_17352:374-1102(-)
MLQLLGSHAQALGGGRALLLRKHLDHLDQLHGVGLSTGKISRRHLLGATLTLLLLGSRILGDGLVHHGQKIGLVGVYELQQLGVLLANGLKHLAEGGRVGLYHTTQLIELRVRAQLLDPASTSASAALVQTLFHALVAAAHARCCESVRGDTVHQELHSHISIAHSGTQSSGGLFLWKSHVHELADGGRVQGVVTSWGRRDALCLGGGGGGGGSCGSRGSGGCGARSRSGSRGLLGGLRSGT